MNANHVFLCEPLINTVLGLQAIACVHRIGQQRETMVWMYLVADTVKESIYNISVTRRLAHLRRSIGAVNDKFTTATVSALRSRTITLRERENGLIKGAIDVANSLELQSADPTKLLMTGKIGGEVVGKQDLWQCLFGKAGRREQELGLAARVGRAG